MPSSIQQTLTTPTSEKKFGKGLKTSRELTSLWVGKLCLQSFNNQCKQCRFHKSFCLLILSWLKAEKWKIAIGYIAKSFIFFRSNNSINLELKNSFSWHWMSISLLLAIVDMHGQTWSFILCYLRKRRKKSIVRVAQAFALVRSSRHYNNVKYGDHHEKKQLNIAISSSITQAIPGKVGIVKRCFIGKEANTKLYE